MNYEKFKAEVQEEFLGDWEFSDQSTKSGCVEFTGTKWGQIEKFSARCGTLSIYWERVPGTDFPVTMGFGLARPFAHVPVTEKCFKSVSAVKLFLLEVESAVGVLVRSSGEVK